MPHRDITVKVSGFELRWVHDQDTNDATLTPQTKAGNILQTLAEMNHPEVSRLALEIVWSRACAERDTHRDALLAYSRFPLQTPPDKYLSECLSTDWDESAACGYRSIVLAGLESDDAHNALLRAMHLAPAGMRDEIFYAASASRDSNIIARVIQLALQTDAHEASLTGEIRTFTDCFRTWFDRGVLDVDELARRMGLPATPSTDLMRKTLLNSLEAPGWQYVPYPELLSL